MDSVNESAERIMERVRERNMELSASMEQENENVPTIKNPLEKSEDVSGSAGNEMPVDVPSVSPLKNKTNNAVCTRADKPSSPAKTPSRMKSRFSELAAEYEQFEIDQNWHPPALKPKEAYMRGVSPRLSMGETRPSVLCTPAGMAQLKTTNTAKSPNKEPSPLKPVTVTCNKTPQKLETVKETTRRITFAQPISDTHVMTDESSLCSTINTADESTILAGAPPIPASRSFTRNKDGEVDLSNDEYGAHTFTKKWLDKQK
ncbi:unnamed protein product [Strongylus vulgaris]|uniref:Uncharacterized protein n=1 Tax=Strongylus vulgaris TaxID=40348 RepID=A0A3P7IKZ8_STRVU|nr:unnamed protein product [Strongylus vulgaris]